MIEGGWAYVTPAYAVTAIALIVLVAVAVLRARHWAALAKPQDKPHQ
jgi:heme exporter protein D